MKYQVGDEILVLHSHEEGKVIEIINDKMVLVEVRGVRFPAYLDQLDFPYFHRFSKKKIVPDKEAPVRTYIENIPKEKKSSNQLKTENGVWLILVPRFITDEFGDELVDYFKVYLVNQSKANYNFNYTLQVKEVTRFNIASQIHPFQDFYIHDVDFGDMSSNPQFLFEFIMPVPDKMLAPHQEAMVKLRGKQVFQQIEQMKEGNTPTLSYKLFDQWPKALPKEEKTFSLGDLAAAGFNVKMSKKPAREFLAPARTVVDLHIEKLTNDHADMDSFEILTLQMSEFEKYYDLALAHHQPQLTIIHGVGKGRLREELHERLKQKKEVKTFVNQYDSRFGYGATEIIFK